MIRQVYQDLLGEAMMRLPPLPGSRFFDPTPSFLVWARKNLKGRFIYDVGAGDGHTSKLLASLGLMPKAIDAFPREDPVYPVRQADGTDFNYEPGSTVMICRPCHGEFPLLTIEQAEACRVRDVLYVGLQRNVRDDLGKYRKKFRLVLKHAGASDESVWRWFVSNEERMSPVALVLSLSSGSTAPYWYIDRGDYWENVAGGRRPKSESDRVLERSEIVEYDFQMLDWTKTGYNMPDAAYGWLSPKAEFYGCEYMGHSNVAYFILKREISDLEDEGWCKVDDVRDLKYDGIQYTFYCKKDLTSEQKKWLVDHGHNLDPYGFRDGEAADDAARTKKYVAKSPKRIKKKYDGD